jgi:lipopolysaccharide/colanic/teichoic acid biosynthesis glycosyltransferase
MGFTGLWYIQSIKANSLDQILIADAYYTATRTWYGDLKIILQTPLAGFRTRLVQDKMSVREDVFSANHTFNES